MLRRLAKQAIKKITSNGYSPLNRIELDSKNMLLNVSIIKGKHTGFEIIPVLKGNAYGHGIEEVAEILNYADCKYLAVDGYFEAASIRDITKHRILVMGYIKPENVKLLDVKKCSFVIQDIEGLKALGELTRPVKVHLELNTGFNRLGLSVEELPGYLKALKQQTNLELEGVMTHLADADNSHDETYNDKQLDLFDKSVEQIFKAGFKPKLIHIAQTAGSPKIKSKYANAIRLGIGLYGIHPLEKDDKYFSELKDLKPVLELKSTIVKVLELKKGDKVSYNCTYTASGPMRVGILPLGYYEGVQRVLSNRGCAIADGKELPIVGRVCMNHTMIDLKKTGLGVGSEVVVIGKDNRLANSVISLQSNHGLFAYTTLTGLSSSVRRIIR